MIRRLLGCIIALALCLTLSPSLSAAASSAAPYYEGKTIRLISATAAGGGVDILARLVARHITKHIPGNPLIIIQNIPRPTAVGGANYVYNIAKRDGLTFGAASAGLFSRSLSGSHPGVHFDLQKFTWLANMHNATVIFWMRTDFPCQTLEALKRCPKPLQFGATSRGSTGYGLVPELIKEALGLNMEIIYGYLSRDIPGAVERGEIDASGGSVQGFFGGPSREMMKKGQVRILFQVGARKSPVLESYDVPWVMDLLEPKYTKLFTMINPIIDLARPYFAPPAIPENTKQILQEAFRRLAKDADFRAEVKRATRTEPNVMVGVEVVEAMQQMFDQPPEVKDRVMDLLKGN